MAKEKNSIIKEDKATDEDYFKLKRSNEKKKALIVIISFVAILSIMTTVLFYLEIINNGNNDKNLSEKDNSNCQYENTNNSQTTSNSYKIFSDNLKKRILGWSTQSYLAKDGIGYSNNNEVAYKIILTNKMQLIMTFDDEQYQKKYGEKIIADNVISFSIAQSGPGAYQNVYFIKDDGTVGEAIPANLFDDDMNKLTITYPIGDLKNIVSVVTASYQDSGYMQEPIFIDINGNVFEAALSAWD